MYCLMLVRSELRDLWHEGCGRVAECTARGEAKLVLYYATRPQPECVKHELTNIKINGLLLLRGRH